MTERPTLRLIETTFYERDVTLRMPFRFGVVTLTEAPQTFVRTRIRLQDGSESCGMAAEMLAPKWFDKSPDLSNDDNFNQLRQALGIAAATYTEVEDHHTAFALHSATAAGYRSATEAAGLPPLVAGFGTALLDRAILDALLRAKGLSVFDAAKTNLFGLDAATTPDLGDFDFDRFLAGLAPAETIAARHTVGLVDPITDADLSADDRVGDGLPETLEEVVDHYGVSHFKLKVSGDQAADVARLTEIAGVIDRLPAYAATLDGNEQYSDCPDVVALWQEMASTPSLDRLRQSILFIEQPITRTQALAQDITPLAALAPVEIDESDATMEAFLTARSLGYTGVSSKSCKGFYHSLLNRARCAKWNAETGGQKFFMSAEDLTTQAGLAVQQDLALATLIGCTHIERNGHHYVNGMAGVSKAEQDRWLSHHTDLYHRAGETVRLTITDGTISLRSLNTPGLGSAVLPEVDDLAPCAY